MPLTPNIADDQYCALIVRPPCKVQPALVNYVTLMLNYRYGLQIIVVEEMRDGATMLRKYSKQMRCVFVIQDEKVSAKMVLLAMSLMGRLPLFLLCPMALMGAHTRLSEGMKNVVPCAWELALRHSRGESGDPIAETLRANSIQGLLEEVDEGRDGTVSERVMERVQGLRTLPAMPELVMRLMQLVDDPVSTTQQLEQVLLDDPSVVLKLLQTVNSTTFKGNNKQDPSLKEAIVRLGTKKVAAIAQQIKLMNSFVRPEESEFDIGRFWEHSLACALVADILPFALEVQFDAYWVSCILHDLGKMVLGFFFWDHFHQISEVARLRGCSFHEAETHSGTTVEHDQVGQLLLIKSKVNADLIQAVRGHHALAGEAPPLSKLLFIANNLSKDLGFGYLSDETGEHSDADLEILGIGRQELSRIREHLRPLLAGLVKETVRPGGAG
jgi:HD-like signal output (HDOD) protein